MIRITIIFILLSTAFYAQALNRYTDSLFDFNQEVTNGIYATAAELNSPYQGEALTHSASLKYHLFSPVDDTLKKRPMLICIHGGAFVAGSKENEDMMEFAKIFAQRGYVTATIQYRLGMNMLSSISGERAVYRGLQDGRAAIRYFKENADTYGIDTNYIYLIGSSAGSFIGLHNLFMNEESERPAGSYQILHFPATTDDGPDLGSLDAVNPTLKHDSHPNGVISLWGAIQDTALIKENDGDIPLLLVHGTADNIVPFDVGSPFNSATLPPTYGSNPINNRLNSIGKNAETYFVNGEGHEFYGVLNGNWNPEPNAYWDTVVTKTTDFLWRIHKPKAEFTWDNFDASVQFNDQSAEAQKWFWDFGDSSSSEEQNPMHEYDANGVYLVELVVQNSIDSWDTTSAYVEVIVTGVEDIHEQPTKFELFQNHPNPFNPSTVISFSLPEVTNVKITIYNAIGQNVMELVNEQMDAGLHNINFSASDLSTGFYLYRLETASYSKTMKMILLR